MRKTCLLAGAISLAFSACQQQTMNAAEACVSPSAIPAPPPNAPPKSSYVSTDLPPSRFRDGADILVQFRNPLEVDRLRRGDSPPVCGMVIRGCVKDGRMILPNPNHLAAADFHRITAHELGHVNGWPPWHGE